MYEAGGAGMVYHGMDEDDVQRIMREPFTMIASDSGVRQIDESVPHPGATATTRACWVVRQRVTSTFAGRCDP